MELYTYRISSFTVMDGDTVSVTVELGFDIAHRTKVRLQGIDTPEKTGKSKAAGLAVADWLRWLLTTYGPITLHSNSWDKFGGRVDGELFIYAPGKKPLNVSDLLLKRHMAQKLSASGARSPWGAKALSEATAASKKRDIKPWQVE